MPLSSPKLLESILRLRCPVCLEGKVFRSLFETHPRCPQCGYYFARESGYFLGSVYFGYGATLFVVLAAWLIAAYVARLESDLTVLAILLVTAIAFPIWFFRYSRMLWMVLDLYLNPPVKEDFQERGR